MQKLTHDIPNSHNIKDHVEGQRQNDSTQVFGLQGRDQLDMLPDRGVTEGIAYAPTAWQESYCHPSF